MIVPMILVMASVTPTAEDIELFGATANELEQCCVPYDSILLDGGVSGCDATKTYRIKVTIHTYDSFLCPTIIDTAVFYPTITWDPCVPGQGDWVVGTDTIPHNPNDGLQKGPHYECTVELQEQCGTDWVTISSDGDFFPSI